MSNKRTTVVDDDEDDQVNKIPRTSVIDEYEDEEEEVAEEEDEEEEEEADDDDDDDDHVAPVAWGGVEDEGDDDEEDDDDEDADDDDENDADDSVMHVPAPDRVRQVIDLTDGHEDHAIYELGEENMDEDEEDDEDEDEATYVYCVIHDKEPLNASHEREDTHIVGIYRTMESATVGIRAYILAFFEPEDIDFEEDEDRDFTDQPFIREEHEDINGCNDRVFIDIHRLHA